MKVAAIILCAAVFGLTCTFAQTRGPEFQTWTNKQGQVLQATFLGIDGENVQLKLSDGRRVSVPVTSLSLDSQAQLRVVERDAVFARVPPLFHHRLSKERRSAAVAKYGGDPAVLAATRKALDWMAARQNTDGSFGNEHTAAATGLALLAFLGHGETPDSASYGGVVSAAALYLMTQGKQEGGLISNGNKKGNHVSYEHAIATQALAELQAMTGGGAKPIPELESSLKKALDLIADGATKDGGWLYGYRGSGGGDLSLSNWQIQALWLAQQSEVEFKGVESALKKGAEFVQSMQDAKGAFVYRSGDPAGKPSLTGGALFSLRNGSLQGSTQYVEGLKYLSDVYSNPQATGSFYSPYFNTLAFFHEGGDAWQNYQSKFIPSLLSAQESDGSWETTAFTKAEGGAISTAWGVLMLEVYYRYARK